MSEPETDYWAEAVSCAFDEADAYSAWTALSDQQKSQIARSLEISHECYGMAFYQPPASDRLNAIEREWKAKYEALEKQFDVYREDAKTAVRQALGQQTDANISIGKYGEVRLHNGRSDRIQ